MNTMVVKCIFWILMALPMLALGIYLFSNVTGDIYARFKEDEKVRKEKERQVQRRQAFEESYSRRRSGGK